MIREMERVERREKKNLEKKWEIMKWISEFISENEEKWKEDGKLREEEANRKMADWERKTMLE